VRVLITHNLGIGDHAIRTLGDAEVLRPLARFIFDEFGRELPKREAAFLCEFLFDLALPAQSLWICRRSVLRTEDYVKAVSASIGADTGVWQGQLGADLARKVADLRRSTCPGYLHYVSSDAKYMLATMLQQFWNCGSGRWLVLGGCEAITRVVDSAIACDSARQVQKQLPENARLSRVAATSYDDSVIEGMSISTEEYIGGRAAALAKQHGLDLSTDWAPPPRGTCTGG